MRLPPLLALTLVITPSMLSRIMAPDMTFSMTTMRMHSSPQTRSTRSTPPTPSNTGDVCVDGPAPLADSSGVTTPSPPLERESQQKAMPKLQGDVSTDNETSKTMKGLPFLQAVAAGFSQQAGSRNANTPEPVQTTESLKKELADLYNNFSSRECVVFNLEEDLKAKDKENSATMMMNQVHQQSISVLRETVASRNADVVSAEENVALHLKTIETLRQKNESREDKISGLKRIFRYHEEQEAAMEQRQNQLILREFEAGRNERRLRAQLVQTAEERNAVMEELEFFLREYLEMFADQDQFHGQRYEVEVERVRRHLNGTLGREVMEQALEVNREWLAHDKQFQERKYEVETERLRRHLNRALERATASEQALKANSGRLAHNKEFQEQKYEVETERLRRHLNRALERATTSEQALEANREWSAHVRQFQEQTYEIETERLHRHLNQALERSANLEDALDENEERLAHNRQFQERKYEVETERLRRHLNRALQETRELQNENAKLKKEAAAAQNGPGSRF
ncbi:hypothetical protein EYC80_009404 [Monilinia laxa]|uniref:Uncharacterized protein n=1 Tax=Monilinia laxa TaxID=61186 RepID=A0A5N6JXP9_MONLA|nr:hypothetical protein EYC80_009404 [Monilinia laxa]